MSDRWRFNEEDARDEETTPDKDNNPPEDALEGQDEAGVVTVHAAHDGQVLSTTLAADWKKSVEPHELPQRIVAAANAATMQAVAKQMEIMRFEETVEAGTPPKQGDSAQADGPPLTVDDALGMIDAVSADLERFTQNMAEVANQTVTVDSAGGHVHGTSQQGQVLEISLDTGWAGRSRNAEIENEITDVLGSLRSKSSLGELANGPQSDSISQIMALAGDPQTLLRRLGLTH